MKVKCIKLLDAFGKEVEFSHWLTINKVYDVMSISIEQSGEVSYRIVTYWRDGEWPDIGLHKACCFEIIDVRAPENWGISISLNGYIEIAPKKWLENGFMEKFYDHEPNVFLTFKEEYDFIVASNS